MRIKNTLSFYTKKPRLNPGFYYHLLYILFSKRKNCNNDTHDHTTKWVQSLFHCPDLSTGNRQSVGYGIPKISDGCIFVWPKPNIFDLG
jgi:hypothetical protein